MLTHSAPFLVESDVGKVQFHVNVAMPDRIDSAKTLAAVVEVLDGETWKPVRSFTWQGHSEPIKAGWPATGPTMRESASVYASKQVRLTVDTGDVEVEYAVEISQ